MRIRNLLSETFLLIHFFSFCQVFSRFHFISEVQLDKVGVFEGQVEDIEDLFVSFGQIFFESIDFLLVGMFIRLVNFNTGWGSFHEVDFEEFEVGS